MPDGTAVHVLCVSAAATRALGRALGARLDGGDVVVLSGSLGAGKTTFVQGLALGLGVTSPVTSPTFVLAREQRPDPSGPRPDGPHLVHVDAYRLAGAPELDDLDLDSDLARSVVVVEWGEGLAERLSPRRVEVAIDRDGAPDPGEPGPHDVADDASLDEPRAVQVRLVGEHPGLDHATLDSLAAAVTTDQEAPC
ncbi:tRNA (adenosine(37)-N6)-threonylcarbamoyltransferase complex ATPase subunit type 1 TsaE [Aquipuribacter sp. MA13-6]|uniref:tRNA (adenosine(37)-N6)-threonylcarbamoyltransferase complex ATPase subunit type 1 TsaE n=1 Tax=unclassified Aquipuribacter TaxID=2635084 RepID=UPI003EECEEE4